LPTWDYQVSLENQMLLSKLPANTVVKLCVDLLLNEMGVKPKAAFSSVLKGAIPFEAHRNGSLPVMPPGILL